MPWDMVVRHNGFASRQAIDEYVKYATTCFQRYKDKVKYWLTFNEINVAMMGFAAGPMYGLGVIDPDAIHADHPILFDALSVDDQTIFEGLHNEFVASALAVKAGHEINPDFVIGCMIAYNEIYPLTPHPKDVLESERLTFERDDFCGDIMVRGEYSPAHMAYLKNRGIDTSYITPKDLAILKEGPVDMYTFSYYASDCASVDPDALASKSNMAMGLKNPYLQASEWGWQIDPDGLHHALRRLSGRYPHTPLMIVENGFGAVDTVEEDGSIHDPYRIAYFREHIKGMAQALENGANLIGYTSWGPIDIVSAGTGQLAKRYGFIYVDKHDDGSGDLSRKKKDSFDWYARVCHSNGADLGENT